MMRHDDLGFLILFPQVSKVAGLLMSKRRAEFKYEVWASWFVEAQHKGMGIVKGGSDTE